MQYEYDTYGNMTGREDGFSGIAEDFGYDNLGCLVSAPDGDITYDSKGNITVHDAAGVYGYDPARPYALSQITLTASGFPSSEQAVSYNSMNRPIGQSFIFDRPNIEGYTIPVTNFPELLLNLLNKVYK